MKRARNAAAFDSWSGAWLRFIIALVGLCLAFFSALLSTVMRQQGSEWGTIVAASCALFLAAGVAVAIVPYLAQRVALERVRQVLQYDLTREGIIYLAVALIIGIAALNTGNNLLFMILAAMLAAIVVSGIASALVLRNLQLDIKVPQHVFAKRPANVRVELRNAGRLPSFSVAVVRPAEKTKHRFTWETERAKFHFPPKAKPQDRWFTVPDIALRRIKVQIAKLDDWFHQPVYFPYLPARATASQHVELTFHERGSYRQSAFGLSTRFPFSFLKKTRVLSLEQEIVVYPNVSESDLMLQEMPTFTGEYETFIAGRGNDLYRIRPYAPGDPARSIDWKATARTAQTMTREFSREDERKVRIVFDNPTSAQLTPQQYEAAVQLSASMAWALADGATDLTFTGAGASSEIGDIFEMLRHLALVQPEQNGAPYVLDSLPKTDDYNLIFTARDRGSVPTELWRHSYCIFLQEL